VEVPAVGHRDAMNTTDLTALLATARSRRSLPVPRVRRMLRENAGLSQRDIAEVLAVTESAVSRWESGKRTPTGQRLGDYAVLLATLAREIAA
jgi:DNA-binding transcriptional regulator YiaG